MKTSLRHTYLPLAALLAFASGAHAAEPTVQDQIDALKARIAELDSKVRPLQRAETTAGDKGFILSSPDAATSLRIRGLIQVDSRWYGEGLINNDAIVLRRGRLGIEGKINKTVDYTLIGEYAGSSAGILDAFVNVAYSPEFQVKLGRFKTPVGLEQLQGDAVALFTERSLVSQIAPNRDIGIQLGGDLRNGTVSYAIGVFNGIQDGGDSADSKKDTNDGKDIAARVTFQPWVNDEGSALAGLTFGVGASYGLQESGVAASYKTDGQQTFFTGSVAAGKVSRLSPQFSYYNGGLSVLGEYIASEVAVSASSKLKNTGWQLATGYVLTGEKASYKGVQPANDFDRASGGIGAVELVARVAVVDIDDGYLTTAALANQSATKATSWSAGVNWYLSKQSRLSLDFTHTEFDLSSHWTGASNANNVLRNAESAILTRYQLNF